MNFRIPRIAHILIVVSLAILGAVAALAAKGQLQIDGPIASLIAIIVSVLHSVDPAAAEGWKEIPITTVRPPPPPPAAQRLMLFATALFLSGCLNAPVVPVTPENRVQVQTCSNIAALHNGVVIGDFIVGAGSTGVASAAALVSDVTSKNDLAIAGIILGGSMAVGTATAGLTAVQFNSSHCGDIVGPLPAKGRPE